jgi:prepilin-type N-terminal cleavage/methylation domain-containing protein
MNLVKDRRGFSLVEVLIAIFLLSIAIMGLATLQARGIRSNDLANRTTQAGILAQFKLEEFIHRTSATVGETFAAGTTQDDENPIDGVFLRSWEFTNDSPVPNAQTVVITVKWNDIIGEHEVKARGVITSQSY